MPPLKIEDFFARTGVTYYKKGETIVRAGDQPRGVFYLKEGYVRIYSLSPAGEELTIIILKPEDIFPYSWAISDIGNRYYYETMTPVEVRKVSKDELHNFINNNADVLLTLSNRIVVRMMGLAQRMEYLAFGNAYSKVASIILICAERFGKNIGQDTVIQVPLTHRDIANLVGMTRETVSVEMKKLAHLGLINYKGKTITVRNLAKLREESLLSDEV